MIELNQLRIGNLVKEYDEVKKVNAIKPHGVDFEEGNFGVCPPQDMNPIPLTEAVLMAAGCEKKTCGYGTPYLWNEYLFKNEGHMNFDKQGGGWVFKRSLYGNTIIIAEVAYLHQLQNLIFCLTDEELEINMEELKKAVG